jgi:uncharacterized membrane protein (UPF0127 family)
MRTAQIWNATQGRLLAGSVEIAETSWRRMRGFLGRKGLSGGEGLWIRPSSGVHTIGMSFAIDVIGLDRKGHVVKLWNHLVPRRLTSLSWRLGSVLELPSGTIASSGTQIGDALHMEPVDYVC